MTTIPRRRVAIIQACRELGFFGVSRSGTDASYGNFRFRGGQKHIEVNLPDRHLGGHYTLLLRTEPEAILNFYHQSNEWEIISYAGSPRQIATDIMHQVFGLYYPVEHR